MKRKFVYSILLFLLVGCLMGFGTIGQEEKPVVVGALVPMTGTQAVFGEEFTTAFKIAEEEINKAGGVLGRPIKVLFEDTEVRPASGMDAARKLVEVNEVPVLLGGFSSGVSLPIAKYCQEKGVVFVIGPPTSPLFADVGDYIFMIDLLDTYKGKFMAEWAVNEMGKKKYGLMFMNNAFGIALMEATKENLDKLGVEVVSEVVYELNKVDYKAELQRLFANDPDAIIGTWYAKEGLVTIKQAYEMGLLDVEKVPWYVPEIETSFADALKKVPELLEGVKGITPAPTEALFNEKFKEKTGHYPFTGYTAMDYDGLVMAAMAMNFAHSTDPAMIKDALFVIDDWYRGQSTGGDKRFAEDGTQAHGKYRKVIVKNGEIVPIEE